MHRDSPSVIGRARLSRPTPTSIGVLLACGIGVAGALPLARVPYFASHDGLVHLWRVWEYARLVPTQGPVVRWAPDVAYGLGAPLFTFYNPLGYALGALVMAAGATAAEATRLVFAATLVVAALGAYRLGAAVAAHRPVAAGLVAALLYALAPYRLATIYERGALAESIGLALAPWVVLAARRAAVAPSWRAVGLLALATGGLGLAHTIAAVLALPFAGLYGLAWLIERPRASWPRASLALVVGFGLGLAVAATYWLPAFAEQATVQLERARWTGATSAFSAGFVWPWQVVQRTLAHDYGRDFAETAAAGSRFPRIGAPAALGMILAAAVGLLCGPLRRPPGLLALAAIGGSLALAAPLAEPLWEHVALLGSIQLGWRMLGLTLLAAIPVSASLADRRSRLAAGAGLTLALVAAAGALVRLPVEPIAWSAASERPAELAAFERKAGQFALGALREYVPAWSSVTPEELTHNPRPRLDARDGDVVVGLIDAEVDRRRYVVQADAPTTLRFDLFFHPSLRALVDGAPVALAPSGPEGLASLEVPAGRHELSIGPAVTPIELAGTLVSAGALMVAGLLAVVGGRTMPRWPATGRAGGLVCGLGAVAALIGLGFPWSGSTAGAAGPASATVGVPGLAVELGGGLRGLGVSTDLARVGSAGILTLDLHLLARRGYARDEPLRVWLDDGAGRVVGESIGGPANGFRPSSWWQPNELLRARTELRLPADTPAGTYTVMVAFDGATRPLGQVELPTVGAAPGVFGAPLARHESIFGDTLVLDGYVYDRDPRGEPLAGSFWWRRIAPGGPDRLTATLRLLDKQGHELAAESRALGGAASLRPQVDLLLQPAEPVAAESYRLELRLEADGRALPARTFQGEPSDALLLTWLDLRDPCNCLPADAIPVGQEFADGIELAAWRGGVANGEAVVSLYWRARATPSRNYTVFLHLLDGDRVVAQVDEQPNAGRRPTGGWQPGDLVHDRYRLPVRAGTVTALRVGLYTPEAGARLPLIPPTADNAVTLPLGAPR